MNIFLNVLIFILGTMFGSFLSLAIYRIPLKKNITHERSFCTKCNHRLEFLDLIPILSYIFLKGKCRYCGEKVRIRYLLLELFSGLVFLLGFISLKVRFEFLEINKIAEFISFVFMYITIIMIAGIDKENRTINKPVIIFGLIMQYIYILYLYIVGNTNVYRYGIYLIFVLVFFLIDRIIKKIHGKSLYAVQILILCMYINICVGSSMFLGIAIATVLISILYTVISHIKHNINDSSNILAEKKIKELPIGFTLGILAIALVIIENLLK